MESGDRFIGLSVYRRPGSRVNDFRCVLGCGKNRRVFLSLFLEICEPRRGHESPICDQIYPKCDFVGFFRHDIHFGDEFSS